MNPDIMLEKFAIPSFGITIIIFFLCQEVQSFLSISTLMKLIMDLISF